MFPVPLFLLGSHSVVCQSETVRSSLQDVAVCKKHTQEDVSVKDRSLDCTHDCLSKLEQLHLRGKKKIHVCIGFYISFLSNTQDTLHYILNLVQGLLHHMFAVHLVMKHFTAHSRFILCNVGTKFEVFVYFFVIDAETPCLMQQQEGMFVGVCVFAKVGSLRHVLRNIVRS